MVQTSNADPFDALVANGVTAAGPDPSAEPTVLIDGSEDEVVWLPPREPEPAPVVKPAKRATRPAPRPAGFAPWPGERTTANPPPRDGEPLKRPSF